LFKAELLIGAAQTKTPPYRQAASDACVSISVTGVPAWASRAPLRVPLASLS